MTSSVHMSRALRAHPRALVALTQLFISLTTSHDRRGSRARVTRRFSRAGPTEATTEPWWSGSASRKGTISSSTTSCSRPSRKASSDPVTASSGVQPSPTDRGRSMYSSVWVRTSLAVASARSR